MQFFKKMKFKMQLDNFLKLYAEGGDLNKSFLKLYDSGYFSSKYFIKGDKLDNYITDARAELISLWITLTGVAMPNLIAISKMAEFKSLEKKHYIMCFEVNNRMFEMCFCIKKGNFEKSGIPKEITKDIERVKHNIEYAKKIDFKAIKNFLNCYPMGAGYAK